MKKLFLFFIILLILAGCGHEKSSQLTNQSIIMENTINSITDSLLLRFAKPKNYALIVE